MGGGEAARGVRGLTLGLDVKCKRGESDGLHFLEIHECPIAVLDAVARAAAVDVTVEHVTPVRAVNEWFDAAQTIDPSCEPGRYPVRNATFDVALTNAEFLRLMPFWDRNGVYAIFTERSPIAFQASSLEPPARYRALANFGFVLEFAMPGLDGWTGVVTPRKDLADIAETIATA